MYPTSGVDHQLLYSPSLDEDEGMSGNETTTQPPAKQEPSPTPPMGDLKIRFETAPGVPKKRGRPRNSNKRTGDSASSSSSSSKPQQPQRTPHNEVERKYRLGLNAELERLRQTIPTLPQPDPNSLSAPPRPSKATVLASAVDYIKAIERDVEDLEQENERLREIAAQSKADGSASSGPNKSPRRKRK